MWTVRRWARCGLWAGAGLGGGAPFPAVRSGRGRPPSLVPTAAPHPPRRGAGGSVWGRRPPPARPSHSPEVETPPPAPRGLSADIVSRRSVAPWRARPHVGDDARIWSSRAGVARARHTRHDDAAAARRLAIGGGGKRARRGRGLPRG